MPGAMMPEIRANAFVVIGHRHGRMTGFAVKAFNLMVLSDRCRKGDRTKQDQKADERQIECFHSVQAL